MSNDVEELLRDGMRRATAQVQMAPALAGRLVGQAGRNRRKRRLRTRAAIVATAAVATAAGFLAAGTTGQPTGRSGGHSTVPRVQTAAYVLKRASQALTGSASGFLLTHFVVTRGGRGDGRPIAPGGGWLYFKSAEDQAELYHFPGGWATSLSFTRPHGHGADVTETVIDYRSKTWWTETVPVKPGTASPPFSCQNQSGLPYALTAAMMREIMRCSDSVIVGHPRLHGVQTIEIGVGNGNFTIWVNASTYLPVLTALGSPGGFMAQQTAYQWLRATPANLAHLTLPIPPGFKPVPPPA
jgi:hypothetical protein